MIKFDSWSAVAIATTHPRAGIFICCPTATITAALRVCSCDSPAGGAPGLVMVATHASALPLSRVAGKLAGYANLGPRRAYPVLFWLPGTVRESNLHAHLAGDGVPDGLSVATAADDHAAGTGGPAGPVWRVYGRPGRVPLSDVPAPTGDGEPWDG